MSIPLRQIALSCLALVGAATLSACAHLSALPAVGAPERGNVYPGIDVLMERDFDILQGKRVGLITNHTGLSRDNRSTIDVIFESPHTELVALFSPEHGIRGTEDTHVAGDVDETTGLPVHSLYGQTRKPTPEMMEGVEVLIFDIQDIGTRFYTYISTMAMGMEAAKEHGIPFVVLDRPNPIGGKVVDGVVVDKDLTGRFTAIYQIPTRHGMTVGELALMFNDHFGIGCDLHVVENRNWQRWMYWDDTGLLWVNPSPNMKTLNGAILYAGPGALETTSIAVGRGTDRPFEMYGAPYMESEPVAAALNARNIPGVRFVPYSHTPTAPYHKYRHELCHGVFVIITDRDALQTDLLSYHMLQAMYELYPGQYEPTSGTQVSIGNPRVWTMLTEEGKTPEEVIAIHQPELDDFMAARKKYLLYP